MITQKQINKLSKEEIKIIHNYIHKKYRESHKQQIKVINKRHYNKYKQIDKIKKINPIEFIR